MTTAIDNQSDRLSWPRRLWPVAPILLLASTVLVDDPLDASTSSLLLAAMPVVLAIVATGVIMGSRRGMVAGLLLTGLAAYWAWWFGWAVDENISPFSIAREELWNRIRR